MDSELNWTEISGSEVIMKPINWEEFKNKVHTLPKPKYHIGDEVSVMTHEGLFEDGGIIVGIEIEKFYKLSQDNIANIEDISYRVIRKAEQGTNRYSSSYPEWKIGKDANTIVRNIKTRNNL